MKKKKKGNNNKNKEEQKVTLLMKINSQLQYQKIKYKKINNNKEKNKKCQKATHYKKKALMTFKKLKWKIKMSLQMMTITNGKIVLHRKIYII